jgi:hypothetical protein
MKAIVPVFFLVLIATSAHAQLISKFTWESGSLLHADFGTDATSIGAGAFIGTDGSGGTHGINPGGQDIDMIIPGAQFEVNALDITEDFRRKETQASFFLLGSFDFGVNGGSLYVKFLLKKAATDTLVSLTGLYTLANDDAFHTYNFHYNNFTGVATVSVDGAVVYTYNGIGSRSLSWTGATTAQVGNIMDATGHNESVLDNFIVKNSSVAVLSLKLLSFGGQADGVTNELDWTTSQEMNASEFIVERSADGANFDAIGSVAATGSFSGTTTYSFTDRQPAGTGYYRLKMVDADGNFQYSAVKKIVHAAVVTVRCFPNPATDYITVTVAGSITSDYSYTLTASDGKMIRAGVIAVKGAEQQLNIDLSAAPKGLLIVRVQSASLPLAETFKIIKR